MNISGTEDYKCILVGVQGHRRILKRESSFKGTIKKEHQEPPVKCPFASDTSERKQLKTFKYMLQKHFVELQETMEGSTATV